MIRMKHLFKQFDFTVIEILIVLHQLLLEQLRAKIGLFLLDIVIDHASLVHEVHRYHQLYIGAEL